MRHNYLWIKAFVKRYKRKINLLGSMQKGIRDNRAEIVWLRYRQAQYGAIVYRKQTYLDEGYLDRDFKEDWFNGKMYRWPDVSRIRAA